MNPVDLIDPAFAHRLTLTMLHVLWQGCVVGIVAWFGEWALQHTAARWRYRWHLGAMLVMLAAALLTFALVPVPNSLRSSSMLAERPTSDPAGQIPPSATAGSRSIAANPPLESTVPPPANGFPVGSLELPSTESLVTAPPLPIVERHETPSYADRLAQTGRWAPRIALVYFLGCGLLLARLMHATWQAQRLRQRAVAVTDSALVDRLRRQAKHLQLRVVPALAWCAEISVPVVIGVVRPLILLPIAAATDLTADQLQALLTHELAHIRRYDLLLNLLQRLAETLLFFHPVVWLLSRRVSSERELACDELVLEAGIERVRYADALVRMAELAAMLHGVTAPTSSMAATGGSSSEFKRRVLKVLAHPSTSHLRPGRMALVMLVAGLALTTLLSATRMPYSVLAAMTSRGTTTTQPGTPISADEEPADKNPQTPPDNKRADTTAKPAGRYQGRIVTATGDALPARLKLLRRVSGETTKETSVGSDGTFSFDTDPEKGSVRLSIHAEGFAPFDSGWRKLSEPLTLTLVRGATVTFRLQSPDGTTPSSGKIRRVVPWYDDDEQGEFAVGADGLVTISNCPQQTVQFDVRVPGYEELRVQRLLGDDLTLDVPLTPARPARLRLVSGPDRRPVAGAKVRFFSRVRANSFLTPFRYYGNDEVWGESNSDGFVELSMLRAHDPVPSSAPGAASYAFRIDAANHASYYLANVRAGADLGDIVLEPSLRLQGQIEHAADERVSLQVRQPTVAHGGDPGQGDWETVRTIAENGTTSFRLEGLRSGPCDLFVVVSSAAEPPGSPRGTIRQLQFLGKLTGNSTNLRITRDAVSPGDGQLTARRESLLPIDDNDRSNVSSKIVEMFVPQSVAVTKADGQQVVEQKQPALQPLLVWSHSAPMQHSLGYVTWRIVVLQDGTVFVPGASHQRVAGILYQLSTNELATLRALLEKHEHLFGRQVPKELPQFAGWRHGYDTLFYGKNKSTQSFTSWHGVGAERGGDETELLNSYRAITEHLERLIVDAACGGPDARRQFRLMANQALTRAIPNATPFGEDTWTNSTIHVDGTRTIRFANADEKTEVTLVQPTWGPPYVERIEYQGKRWIASTGQARTADESRAIPAATLNAPENQNAGEKVASESNDAALEFRIPANLPGSTLEPRVPDEYEQRRYPENTRASRQSAKDSGFVWIKLGMPKVEKSTLPIQKSLSDGQILTLLADSPEHAVTLSERSRIESSRVVAQGGKPARYQVELTLDEAGGAALRKLTESHLNHPLAIVVRNEIVAVPIIRTSIDRNIAISGLLSREQAEKLVANLQANESKPQEGLEFLKPYPKLHGLSLKMSEARFKALARRESLTLQTTPPRMTAENVVESRYAVPTGDGHSVLVMFRNGQCHGIQRVRGDATQTKVTFDRFVVEFRENLRTRPPQTERLEIKSNGDCLYHIDALPPRETNEGKRLYDGKPEARLTSKLAASRLLELERLLAATNWLTADRGEPNGRPLHHDDVKLTVVRNGQTSSVTCVAPNEDAYRTLVWLARSIAKQEHLVYSLDWVTNQPDERNLTLLDLRNGLEALDERAGRALPEYDIDYLRLLPTFSRMLRNPGESEQELLTALVLAGHLRADAEFEFVARLKHDRNSSVRDGVAETVVNYGGERAVPILAEMAPRCEAARWGLVRLGPLAVPTLVKLIEPGVSRDESVAEQLVRAYLDHRQELPGAVDARIVAAARTGLARTAERSQRTVYFQEFLQWMEQPANKPATPADKATPAETSKGETDMDRPARQAQQPRGKESQALLKVWQRTARANGDIPGGTIARLAEVISTFLKYNPTYAGAPKLAELLKRIDVRRDWKHDEVVALLDEVSAIYAFLPDWVEGEHRFRLGGSVVAGKPLPESLKSAPWGETSPNGLRAAWLLEPSLPSAKGQVEGKNSEAKQHAEFRLNTSLKSRVLIHNSGKKVVVFRALTWHQSGSHAARDAQGNEIKIMSVEWTTIPMVFVCRLAPGEFIEVLGAGIGVGPNRDDEDWRDPRSNARVGAWIAAEAGNEVTFLPDQIGVEGRDSVSENETQESESKDWWLGFIQKRLSLDAPLPSDTAERARLLDHATRDLFGSGATEAEIAAFQNDATPQALAALAKRLAVRPGFESFSGKLASGPTKFKVLPVDPLAAKQPRLANGPGQYALGGNVTLVVTRRPDGERIVNEAHLVFAGADATKPAPRERLPIPLADGYDSWAAAWMRGGTVLWVVQDKSLRSFDFTDPAAVKETPIESRQAGANVPQAILDALADLLPEALGMKGEG